MKVLKVRSDPNRNKWGDKVQVYVAGRWTSNKNFYIGRCSYKCEAGGPDNFEFIQLETVEDCEAVQLLRPFDIHVAISDVFRRCKACGDWDQTFHGYYRRHRRGAVPSIMVTAWP